MSDQQNIGAGLINVARKKFINITRNGIVISLPRSITFGVQWHRNPLRIAQGTKENGSTYAPMLAVVPQFNWGALHKQFNLSIILAVFTVGFFVKQDRLMEKFFEQLRSMFEGVGAMSASSPDNAEGATTDEETAKALQQEAIDMFAGGGPAPLTEADREPAKAPAPTEPEAK